MYKRQESQADVTILYQNVDNAKTDFINCDTLELNKQKGVLSIGKNRGNAKVRTISLETYILSKELFISLVRKAANTSSLYWFRDIINDQCSEPVSYTHLDVYKRQGVSGIHDS